jgi:seryl-tRNA synthetase
MLHPGQVREHPDVIRAGLRKRYASVEAEDALEQWLLLDAARRRAATRRDELVQALRRQSSTASTHDLRALQMEVRRATEELQLQETQARRMLMRLPNMPDERVPIGRGPGHGVELRRSGDTSNLSFTPQRHDQLGEGLGILDLPRATRLSGPRFPLLKGEGARLARTLANFMLDQHTRSGYVEISPPHLLKAATLEGTGHLPLHEDELYSLPRDGLWLSPTAEAQLVALHAGETIPGPDLPLAYTACTPAFRREAGGTRSTTPGLLRQHQFDKVELVRISTPEDSDAAFDRLVLDAEGILQRLDLPYRLVALASGDLPFASRRTYDLEVWMPAQQSYVEISSISDCGPFQSRRLNLRYRPSARGQARFPHTLNGSALAIGRTLAAVLENGQRRDGSVAIPEALAGYFGEPLLVPVS